MRAEAIARRAFWITELATLSGSFGADAKRMHEELRTEIKRDGNDAIVDHLRICGAMPECYGHDSSEEKLYSKYTDAVLSEFFTAIGMDSVVIETRADVADVQARGRNFSLVADAKAFRLSRTAKNQKDFKVQAMDRWRHGLDFAVVVCPIYQLPGSSSQIYLQATASNVCILSYSHLAALLGLAIRGYSRRAQDGLHGIFKSVALLNPSKSANEYWTGINRALVNALAKHADLWTVEKSSSIEALSAVKEESLQYLSLERDRLLGLSKQAAIEELIRSRGLASRIATINRLQHGDLLGR